jgi:uncharacterized protein YbjT (DUF2867 family)
MTASSPLPYVVFGVTGRTGAAAADALLRSDHPVRVVVRDPAKGRPWAERGAEVAVADLTDLASMTKALSQAQGAYVVSPQHYNREDLFERADLIADTTARAAVAANVPRLVALSSVGADRESGTGWIRMNRMFEQRLGETGVSTIFLRAAYFMENWIISATLQKPIDVAVLPETQWPEALADAHFSRAALAGFAEMTRGLNCSHIDIKSDPTAVEWTGTTTLERVIVELAQRQR